MFFSVNRRVANRKSNSPGARRGKGKPAKFLIRLRIEELEGRWMPSTLHWVGGHVSTTDRAGPPWFVGLLQGFPCSLAHSRFVRQRTGRSLVIPFRGWHHLVGLISGGLWKRFRQGAAEAFLPRLEALEDRFLQLLKEQDQ